MNTYNRSGMKQWRIYTAQYLRNMEKKNLLVSLAFPVVAALIVIFVAGENFLKTYGGTKSGTFIIVSAAIWGGLFNSISSVVKERANIKRDFVSAGIYFRAYTASRAIIQFLICAVQSFILMFCYAGVVAVHKATLPEHGIIFGSPVPEYYITILLLMYAADCLGLLISCIVKKEETANVLSPYILIVQLIFSGILFEMKGIANKISYVMISRWGMEGLGSISVINDKLGETGQLDMRDSLMEAASKLNDSATQLSDASNDISTALDDIVSMQDTLHTTADNLNNLGNNLYYSNQAAAEALLGVHAPTVEAVANDGLGAMHTTMSDMSVTLNDSANQLGDAASDLDEVAGKLLHPGVNASESVQAMFNPTAKHLITVWIILLSFCLVSVVVGNLLLHNVKKDQR